MLSRAPILLGFLLSAGAVAVLWWLTGRPVAMPDLATERLPCVSYSPHWRGYSPFDHTVAIPVAAMEEDLRALRPFAGCVRTYSTAQNQDQIVPIAARLGMTVLLGAWISADDAANRAQLDRAVAMANAHPETVRAVIVGNEVLLRGEMSAGRLAEHVRQTRERTRVPVTSAEIWSFWLDHPELAEAVDVLTIHILPYWDDQPGSIEQALGFSETIMARIAERFPGRPVLIGEIGWPSFGRARGPAAPGLANQAGFVRGFSAIAARHGWDYNIIEGFDQPWKRIQEGTVGGTWGVLSVAGQPKFPLTGPVSDNPRWTLDLAASVGLGALALVWLLAAARPALWWRGLAAAAAAPVLGGMLVEQAEFVAETAIGPANWVAGAAAMAASAVLAALLLRGLALGRWPGVPALGDVFDRLFRPLRRGLVPALPIGLTGAACDALGLAVDPRHRDFPSVLFLPPAIALLAFGWAGRFRVDRQPVEEAWLAALLLACGLATLSLETLANGAAVLWAVTLAVLAAPLVARVMVWRRGPGARGQGQRNPGRLQAAPAQ